MAHRKVGMPRLSGTRGIKYAFYLITFSVLIFTILPSSMAVGEPTEGLSSPGSESPTSPPADAWPMYGHDAQHTGYSFFDAPDNNSLLWTFDSFMLPPDPLLPPCIGGPMTSASVADGLVFLTYGEPCVVALDGDTGEIVWWQWVDGWASQPVVDDGKVYVASVFLNNTPSTPPIDPLGIHVFDVFTGELLQYWEIEVDDVNYHPPVVVVANGKIFTGATALLPPPAAPFPYTIFAFNQTNGDMLWRRGIEYVTSYGKSPHLSVYNDKVLVSSGTSKLYALDVNNGNTVWEVDKNPEVFSSSIATHDGMIFAGTYPDGKIYALDPDNGTTIWEYQIHANPNGSWIAMNTPAVANGRVIVSYMRDYGIAGGVVALDVPTGDLVWQLNTTGVFSAPTVGDGKVFVGTSYGVQALVEDTGESVWQYSQPFPYFPSFFEHSPAIANGKLFVINGMEDILYVFGPGGTPPQNQPPIVDVYPDYQEADVNEEAWFYGYGSYDPDGYIVSYDWDFGDETFGSGSITSHTYTAPGYYMVTLTVTDDYGANDTDTGTILVSESPEPQNQPPIAVAWPPYQNASVGQEVWFNGNASFDTDGYIVSYDWNFGDFFGLGFNASGALVSHVYSVPGLYLVELTVTDDDGSIGVDIATVLVLDAQPQNQPPVAIAGDDRSACIVDPVYFDGSQSYDPDGFILSFHWDFGDGTFGNGVTTSHVYFVPGVFTVTLTVTDDEGASGIDTLIMVVESSTCNERPYSVAQPEFQMVYEGDFVYFDGSASYDTDGWIVSYVWDFDDGGTASGIMVNHVYGKDGNYTVILTVTDNEGATDTDVVTVIAQQCNQRPFADAKPEFQVGLENDILSFDGSSSYDIDGIIVSYEWDFGDGEFASGMNVTHIYTSAGNYTVELTVTDDHDAVDTDKVYVMVMEDTPYPNQPPVAYAGTDQSAFVGDIVDLDGSQSYDPDGYIVTYNWDFGDGVFDLGAKVSHAYDNPGNYSVSLTVTDDDGTTAIDTVLVTVLEKEIQNESISLEISKVKLSGPDIVFTHSFNEWELKITVANMNDSCALNDVVVTDVLPAEIRLLNFTRTQGTLEVVERGLDGSGATDLTWRVGHLGSPGLLCGPHQAELVLRIGTKQNPAGKQEFTSPSTYILNDGASATGINSVTGEVIEAGPTPSISVTAIDLELMPQNGMLLILTAGPINVATFEEGVSRAIPVEVTTYYGDVHNVHIELVDDGGLEIEVIPIVQDIAENQIARFYLEIKAPMLPDDQSSLGITIKIRAIGEEASSNVEYLDILVRSQGSSWYIELTATISTVGTVGAAAILAALIRRRTL